MSPIQTSDLSCKSPEMPACGAVLMARQIEDIIAYIRILAGSASAKAEGKAK